MTRRLFGKAGFVQVILTSAGNLAPPYHFVDMVLRRVGSWCEHLDMLLTKSDGGHLRGILTLGGLAYLIRIAAMMTMKSAANSFYT